MPKRLFDGLDQGLGEEILLLDNLPPPDRQQVYCGLCWSLGRALTLVGRRAPYARLMGLTGAAFMVPLHEGLALDWASAKVDRYLLEALAGLGVSARRQEGLSETEARAACREELQGGRPLLAEGWETDWAVIVGLKGDELLGQGSGSSRQFERHPPRVRALIAFTVEGEALPAPEAGLQALARARPLLAESREQWSRWQELLEAAEPYGPEPDRRHRFAAEQVLSAAVVEARDAASQFLTELAEQTDFDLADALTHAAHMADQVAGVLEQLLVSPEVVGLAHLPDDPAWLERRRDLLTEVGEYDERLGDAITGVLDVAGEDD